MRRRFDEARATLGRLEPQLESLSAEARVRYHLEYGRTLVSATHEKAEINVAKTRIAHGMVAWTLRALGRTATAERYRDLLEHAKARAK